jgi:hypothetical protein
VEQELLAIPEHLSSLQLFSVIHETQYLCVV